MALTKVTSIMIEGVAGAGRKNILINSSFRVSQRGDYTSATSATHNIYMLDRWQTAISPASTIQDLGGYAELKATAAATGSVRLYQTIEDLYLLEGQTVTVSCEMKSNTANGRLQMHNGSWVADNASHTGGGAWETLSFTVSMPSSLSVTSIQVGIDGVSSANVPIAVGDYCQIKNVQLELGSVATDFEHRSYGEELALCQRYYTEIKQFVFNANKGTDSHWDGHANAGSYPFPVTMRASPSVTIVQTFGWLANTNGWTTPSAGRHPVGVDLTNEQNVGFSGVNYWDVSGTSGSSSGSTTAVRIEKATVDAEL